MMGRVVFDLPGAPDPYLWKDTLRVEPLNLLPNGVRGCPKPGKD